MPDPDHYRVLSAFDAETVPIGDEGLEWLPVRRRLGVSAFGVNAFRAASEGDTVIEQHVESPGQEEVYAIVSGSARFEIDGKAIEAAYGDLVFVPDPQSRRGAVALEDGTVVLAIGGWPDQPYHPLPWEPIYLASGAMKTGDWAAAAATLEREAGEHRDTGIVRYRLACCRARLGEDDLAIEELRTAVEVAPAFLERAAGEEAFDRIRLRDDWPRSSP